MRFPFSEPIPTKVIEQIAKLRAKEVTERSAAKKHTPEKRRVRAGSHADNP